MAYSYLRPNRDQLLLLPPDVRDWVAADHLVWFVLDVVSLVDLSKFHEAHPNDGVGRRAYDPEMMLGLLIYSYCSGIRSSRRIARGCRSDLAMKVICCDVVPDHDAIGRFRADHEQAIKDVFTDVLMLCGALGLAGLGLVAIDGTKIGADAALDANRRESAIAAEVEAIMAEAGALDDKESAQTTLAGDAVEIELPRAERLSRLRAALAEVAAERKVRAKRDAAQDERWAKEAQEGRRPRGRAPADPARALVRARADVDAARVRAQRASSVLDKLGAAEEVVRAERSLAEAIEAARVAPPATEPEANTTDPESRIMKTTAGWIQGFNAQAAVNEHQVVVGADVTNEANDVGQLLPMIGVVEANANSAELGEIGLVLADAGYWSETNATADGPDRLIATTKDWKQRKAAREMGTTTGEVPEGASPLQAMEHRLRSKEGAAAYAKRSVTVEPSFGNVKENHGFRRFMRRGLSAAQSEWSLICATTNIEKMFRYAEGRSLTELLAPGTWYTAGA